MRKLMVETRLKMKSGLETNNIFKFHFTGGIFFIDQTEVLLLSFSGTLVQYIFIELLTRDYNRTNPKKPVVHLYIEKEHFNVP